MQRVVDSFGSFIPPETQGLYQDMLIQDQGYNALFVRDGERLLFTENIVEPYKIRAYPALFGEYRARKIAPLLINPEKRRVITYADELAIDGFLRANNQEELGIVKQTYDSILAPDFQLEDGETFPHSPYEYIRLYNMDEELTNVVDSVLQQIVIPGYVYPPVVQALLATFFVFRNVGHPRFLFAVPPPFQIEEFVNRMSAQFSNRVPSQTYLPSDNDPAEQEFCLTLPQVRQVSSLGVDSASLSFLWKVAMEDSSVVFKVFIDPTYLEDLQVRRNVTQSLQDFKMHLLYGVQYEANVYRRVIPSLTAPWFVRSLGYGRCPRESVPETIFRAIVESVDAKKDERDAYIRLFHVYPRIVIDFLALEMTGQSDLFDVLIKNEPREALTTNHIVVQLLHALYVMQGASLVHNDLHSGNLRIVDGEFSYNFRGTNGVIRSFRSTKRIAIFDWDRAYCLGLGDNKSISPGGLMFAGVLNEFVPLHDFFIIGYRFFKLNIHPFNMQCFADFYRKINRDESYTLGINRLSENGKARVTELQRLARSTPGGYFKVIVADFSDDDQVLFTNMFGWRPIWFICRIALELDNLYYLKCSLHKKKDGHTSVFPCVQIREWPSLRSLLEGAIAGLAEGEAVAGDLADVDFDL